jgi:hypothetical protein
MSIGSDPGKGDYEMLQYGFFPREEVRVGCLEVKLRGQVVSAEHCKTIIIVRTYFSSFD